MVKENSRLRKIRIIVQPINASPVFGVVLPSSIAISWLDIYVTVIESGNQIILQSGARPSQLTKEEIKNNTEIVDKIRI